MTGKGLIGRPTLLIALVSAALLAGCSRSSRYEGYKNGHAVSVQVAVVRKTEVPVYSEAPGRVISSHSVTISSRVSGYVKNLYVDVGDPVKPGEKLLHLDDQAVRGEVAQAKANLSRAEAKYADAEFNYRRYSALYKQQAVSRQSYKSMKMAFESAKAAIAAAHGALDRAKAQQAYVRIRSPIAGVVTKRFVQVGDMATPGRALLMIETLHHLQVQTHIGRTAYHDIHLGGRVLLKTDSKSISATVVNLSPAANPLTETHLLKANISKPDNLSIGQFVRVLVQTGQRTALLVPTSAIVERAGISAVFTLGKKNHAHLTLVRTGRRFGQLIEITAGLKAGDRIITRPTNRIGNGTLVHSEENNA